LAQIAHSVCRRAENEPPATEQDVSLAGFTGMNSPHGLLNHDQDSLQTFCRSVSPPLGTPSQGSAQSVPVSWSPTDDAAAAAALRGPAGSGRVLHVASAHLPGRFRVIPTRANRQPALAVYRRDAPGAVYRAWGIWVVTTDGDAIAKITAFIDPMLLPGFGLPTELGLD
jgi:hypothetical protein